MIRSFIQRGPRLFVVSIVVIAFAAHPFLGLIEMDTANLIPFGIFPVVYLLPIAMTLSYFMNVISERYKVAAIAGCVVLFGLMATYLINNPFWHEIGSGRIASIDNGATLIATDLMTLGAVLAVILLTKFRNIDLPWSKFECNLPSAPVCIHFYRLGILWCQLLQKPERTDPYPGISHTFCSDIFPDNCHFCFGSLGGWSERRMRADLFFLEPGTIW